MSDFKWNAGKGGIFTNKKEKDGQPDSKGELTCPCCEKSLELAAWRKEGNKGPWLSISAKEKGSFQPKQGKVPGTIQEVFGQGNGPAGYEDSIPFAPVRGLML